MPDIKKFKKLLWIALCAPAPVLANNTPEQKYQYEAVYKADVITNTRGGLDTGSGVLGNLDLKLTLNPWQNGQVFLYAISSLGSKPNRDLVGSVQGVDNIEVDTNTAKLYEAWVQQDFSGEQYSLRAGLYDLNSEFYVTDAAGLFINSSSGIGAEFAQTGQNGPSIFPTTGTALRFKALLPTDMYWQAAVLDGVPGDVDDPRHTHIQFHDDEGKLLVSEFGWSHGLPGLPEGGKYSVGYWEYTEQFDDLVALDVNGNPEQQKNSGAYVMAEQTLLDANKYEEMGLVAFVRYGRANNDVNPLENNLNAGVVLSGLVDNDELGFVYSSVENTGKFMQSQMMVGAPVESKEEIFELTYRLDINRWLAVQPDIQYVINPGTDPTLNNAVVVGARFEFTIWP